jgi:hypothetical protein
VWKESAELRSFDVGCCACKGTESTALLILDFILHEIFRESTDLTALHCFGSQGQEFVDGAVFDLKMLKSVYARLSNINFCSCRAEEVAHLGMDFISERFFTDATKDLPYLKVPPHPQGCIW